jgi:hypothetical protein
MRHIFKLNNFNVFAVLLISALFVFAACEKDESMNATVNADAGNDITVAVNDLTTLDGSNSTSSEGTLSYEWMIDSKPAGSNAMLNDASTENPTITPDVVGEFVITLTVSNGNAQDSDQIIITATDGGSNETVIVEGEITENITWTDHIDSPTIPDYKIISDTYLSAELVIEPGVLIQVEEDIVFTVTSNGVLMASGESGNRIEMTSANAMGGQYWKGLKITSTDTRNELSYVNISYAGNSEFNDFADYVDTEAAIAIMDGGVLNINNSKVDNSKGYGMYIRHGELLGFSNNSFEDNASNAIGLNITQASMIDGNTSFSGNLNDVEVFGSSLEETDELTLTNLSGNAKYYFSGSIYINSYLAIDAGVHIDLEQDTEIVVQSGGVFVADASGGDKIVMTSASANSGIHWKGLKIQSEDTRNILSNVEISYAGSSEFNDFADYVDLPTNIAVSEGGKLAVVNSEILNSAGYGMYVRYGELLDFGGNTFANNALKAIGLEADQASVIDGNTSFTGNGWNGVEIFGSTLTQESTWLALNETAKYIISGTINIKAGLNLSPGVDIEIDENMFFTVTDGGYFSAIGNSNNMVSINTSNEAGQIYWGGIWIETADSRNALDYVHLSYAGGESMDLDNYQDPFTSVGGDEAAVITITNSVIENSDGSGVYWQGAGTINDIEAAGANNTFANNAVANVYTP